MESSARNELANGLAVPGEAGEAAAVVADVGGEPAGGVGGEAGLVQAASRKTGRH